MSIAFRYSSLVWMSSQSSSTAFFASTACRTSALISPIGGSRSPDEACAKCTASASLSICTLPSVCSEDENVRTAASNAASDVTPMAFISMAFGMVVYVFMQRLRTSLTRSSSEMIDISSALPSVSQISRRSAMNDCSTCPCSSLPCSCRRLWARSTRFM